MDLAHWMPTVTTAAIVVGMAFVADSSIKRHEKVIEEMRDDIAQLKTDVAVLQATRQRGGE